MDAITSRLGRKTGIATLGATALAASFTGAIELTQTQEIIAAILGGVALGGIIAVDVIKAHKSDN